MDEGQAEQSHDPQAVTLETHLSGTESEQLSDAFINSTFLQRAKETVKNGGPIRLAFLDIDSTITGDNEKMVAVLEKLKKEGYLVFLNTARTEEMLVNDSEFENANFGRPKAHLKPVHQEEPSQLRDPDYVVGISGSTGSNPILHQETGGYEVIQEYRNLMRVEADKWRSAMMEMVIMMGKENFLDPSEFKDLYDRGLNDVSPPDFRMFLLFNQDTLGADADYVASQRISADEIRKFKKKCAIAYAVKTGILPPNANQSVQEIANSQDIRDLSKRDESFLRAIIDLRVGHDSKPDDNQISIMLTPNHGTKDSFERFIVSNTCEKLGIRTNEIDHILIAGDSYADLKAGLSGIGNLIDDSESITENANPLATFFIPAQSRLTRVLHRLEDGSSNPSDETMPAGLKLSAFPLEKSDHPGKYSYSPQRHFPQVHSGEKMENISATIDKRQYRQTEVFIGDEYFPDSESPAKSVLQYLTEKYPDKT